jgi:predicted O-methyltransferase YrrM
MSTDTWTAVDRYIEDRFALNDPALEATLADSAAANLPAISITASQGKFLWTIAKAMGARRMLEIGTLGGYSAIWLARALPPGGRLITMELEPRHADVARKNFVRAGVDDRIDVRVGPALQSLQTLAAGGSDPFDLVFIDADKGGYAEYFAWAVKLARSGTLIIADNVVRDGRILDAASTDESVAGIRRFNDAVAVEPRVTATAVQTVGAKGYDGLAFLLVE